MYVPAVMFRATEAETADPVLAWRRSDQAFFATDASHILAFAAASVFRRLHVVALRRRDEAHASHAIASDGVWAFDHAGWTPEAEILDVTARHEPAPGWDAVSVQGDLGTYCRDHRCRDRHEFAHDPWWRAIAYLAKFPPPPAVTRGWEVPAEPVSLPQQRHEPSPALVR